MRGATISTLTQMKAAGEKIAALTAYDASFARLAEAAGADLLLVGDSLAMVVQGHESTLPVTVGEMVYHTAAVARARTRALLVADMPFMRCRAATRRPRSRSARTRSRCRRQAPSSWCSSACRRASPRT